MEIVSIFGVKIQNTTLEDTRKQIEEYLEENRLRVIYTPNTEIVMKAKDDSKLRDIINKGDIIIPDGIGLIYGSKIQKKPLKERVTGFDTSMEILKIANKKNYKLFLLGGAPSIAEQAMKNINKEYPNIQTVGCQNGFFKGSHLGVENSIEEKRVIEEINSLSPDIIFVGLGFPRQELFIEANREKLKAKIVIGNGGVIDVMAGNAKRAPEIYQRLGLEWFYRLIKNPSRIRRQLEIPKFIWKVLVDKNAVK